MRVLNGVRRGMSKLITVATGKDALPSIGWWRVTGEPVAPRPERASVEIGLRLVTATVSTVR